MSQKVQSNKYFMRFVDCIKKSEIKFVICSVYLNIMMWDIVTSYTLEGAEKSK